MKRSRLQNKASKTKKLTDNINFLKKRNYVANMSKQAKIEYFNSYKYSKADTDIVFNENGNLILKNEEIANTFNDYFSAIVDSLNLHHWEDKTSPPSSTSDKLMTLSRIKKNIQAFVK